MEQYRIEGDSITAAGVSESYSGRILLIRVDDCARRDSLSHSNNYLRRLDTCAQLHESFRKNRDVVRSYYRLLKIKKKIRPISNDITLARLNIDIRSRQRIKLDEFLIAASACIIISIIQPDV